MTHAHTKVFALLDLACREIERHSDLSKCQSDTECSQLGVTTKYMIELCEAVGIEARSTRTILNRAMETGRVLRYKKDDKGMMRWWPAGLLNQLRAEKANVKEVA